MTSAVKGSAGVKGLIMDVLISKIFSYSGSAFQPVPRKFFLWTGAWELLWQCQTPRLARGLIKAQADSIWSRSLRRSWCQSTPVGVSSKERRRPEQRGGVDANNLVPRSWPTSPAPTKPSQEGRGSSGWELITDRVLQPSLWAMTMSSGGKCSVLVREEAGWRGTREIIQRVAAAWQSEWSNRWF